MSKASFPEGCDLFMAVNKIKKTLLLKACYFLSGIVPVHLIFCLLSLGKELMFIEQKRFLEGYIWRLMGKVTFC